MDILYRDGERKNPVEMKEGDMFYNKAEDKTFIRDKNGYLVEVGVAKKDAVFTNMPKVGTESMASGMLGFGQTWASIPKQDSNVVYHNTSDRPILISVLHTGTSTDVTKTPYIYGFVGKTPTSLVQVAVANMYYAKYPTFTVTLFVPAGHYYKVQYNAQTDPDKEIKYARLGA